MRRLGIIAALWLLTGVYIVPVDQQAVVTRFGRVSQPRALPGIHLGMPWPIDRVKRLDVWKLQRINVGAGASGGQYLTGDQNLIEVRAVVQFSVAVPRDYLFTAEEVHRVVGAALESELARRIGQRGVDAVLTTEKTAVQDEARASAQKLLNRYGLGVLVASVSIESAQPPAEALEAFNDVASARADSARIVNEALGYSGDVVPKARGEASQSLQAASAYRSRKVNEARGDAARFVQVSAEYQRAAALNGRRLYLETMEQVLPRIKKLMVDNRGNLDLTIMPTLRPLSESSVDSAPRPPQSSPTTKR